MGSKREIQGIFQIFRAFGGIQRGPEVPPPSGSPGTHPPSRGGDTYLKKKPDPAHLLGLKAGKRLLRTTGQRSVQRFFPRGLRAPPLRGISWRLFFGRIFDGQK